jgi:perosamine synthetase
MVATVEHRAGGQEGKGDMAENHGQRPRGQQMGLPHLEALPLFSRIDIHEREAVLKALGKPLSGYLGGVHLGGYWVERLQEDAKALFKVKHAIACNSATSGLLAACMAIGIKPGDIVWTSAYTMSATAACAKVLGADIACIDIEPTRFSIDMNLLTGTMPKCIIVTNLFGHPAYISSMRSWCESNKVWMIEDNAQSPLAKERDLYAGTVGHIGVFSFNVHKHIQCGEGGLCVTNDSEIHNYLCDAINHGELAGSHCGLNLRMTEPIAAIAAVQLSRAKEIIQNRVELAQELSDMFAGIPWLRPPIEDTGCRHVYYCWAALVADNKRNALIRKLGAMGLPMKAGYSTPIHEIFNCPIMHTGLRPWVRRLEDNEIMTFEVCRYEPNWRQRRTMREIASRAVGEVEDEYRRSGGSEWLDHAKPLASSSGAA